MLDSIYYLEHDVGYMLLRWSAFFIGWQIQSLPILETKLQYYYIIFLVICT